MDIFKSSKISLNGPLKMREEIERLYDAINESPRLIFLKMSFFK